MQISIRPSKTVFLSHCVSREIEVREGEKKNLPEPIKTDTFLAEDQLETAWNLGPQAHGKCTVHVLWFGHPPSHMAAVSRCQCRGFISTKLPPKKDITWQSRCTILYLCVHTLKLLLNIHTFVLLTHPESFLVSVDSLFSPFLPVQLT